MPRSPAPPEEDRAVTPERLPDDAAEATLRPQTLRDFVGQKASRENLAIFIEAARARAEALDHVLLHGPPGLGKTTLAQIVARELGVGFRATSGPVIQRAGDLAAILTNLQPRDVLFIDEIHRLQPAIEEILYPAMEDFQLDLIIGEGPAARSVRIDLSPFTLVGATTRAGLLATPLRDRFGIPLRLVFYTPEELTLIISRGAEKLAFALTPDGAAEIARRSRGTPRIAGRLLRRVRDIAHVAGTQTVDRTAADAALRRLEVDAAGLDAADRRYLRRMAEHHGGGPVGVETLAAALGEARDTLEDVIEPFLIQEGFCLRTSRGRMLGELGWRHLGLDPPVANVPLRTCSRDGEFAFGDRGLCPLDPHRRGAGAATWSGGTPASPDQVAPKAARRWGVQGGKAARPPEAIFPANERFMMRHTHHLRVYFADTDAGRVMYHAAYLGFAERARTEALRDAGLPHAAMVAEHGVMFMVRRLELEYFRPARLDDLLTIRTETLAVTGATVTLRQAFFRPAENDTATELAVARVVLACVHTETGKAARMPPRWRAALAA